MSEKQKKEAYDKIREIDNVVYSIRLTFKEIEQLEVWLSRIETNEEIEEGLLERVITEVNQAKKTGDSV